MVPPSVTRLALAIAESETGTALRESLYLFPLIEGVHLLGLALSFGLIFFTDLRLVGLFLTSVPASRLLRQLRPWIVTGFVLTFATGGLLFWAEADKLVENPAFLAKVVAMLAALANAAWFERALHRQGASWVDQASTPRHARTAGWVSLSFWAAVTVSGRLIPYFSA